nr:FAD-dependent oxidoreductase [Alsobacter ponti]
MTPDLCVIGGGAAGLSAAAGAAALGVPVVLIEKARMGGECLNVGCVPSKALLAAADAAQAARSIAPFGVAVSRPRVDGARVHGHVQRVIAAIAPNDSAARFGAMGVRVLAGEARFVDRRTVEAAGFSIRARRFVIATGSRPALPDVPGLAECPYLTNETVFDLDAIPARLLVLGGGASGLELAQAFRRLGSEVTVIEAGRALGRIDPEIAAHAVTALRRDGVTVLENARAVRAEHWAGGIRVFVAGEATAREGSHLLVAAGRTPVTDGLGLEPAGVACDGSGILVDAGLRTSNRRVFAIGDCVGGPHGGDRFTHVANSHAGVVLRRALFRLPAKVERAETPTAVFTDPEIAMVGVQEAEARQAHRDIRILRWAFSENDRAQAERRTEGEIKIVTTARGKVLGAAIVGPHAGELVTPWTLAVRKGMSIAEFRDLTIPYPTYSEVSRRAALTFYADAARGPWVGRLLRMLRLFG